MSPNSPKALIVNFPERLGESLKSLLASHLDIQEVAQVNGIQSTLRMLEDYSPELIFLEFNSISQESADLLLLLRQRFPTISCIALLLDPSKKTSAMEAGAHFTLVRGFGVPELIHTVKQALEVRGCDQNPGHPGS